jgi:uncharacterized protein YgiB involved in biofilm formation
MKRSKKIALTLLASVSLVACGCNQEQMTRREVYKTKQQCIDDWGSDDACEPDRSGGYYGPHYIYRGGSAYYFPRGSVDPVPVAGNAKFANVHEGMRSNQSVGTISDRHISRGGFGRSSLFHGSGAKS